MVTAMRNVVNLDRLLTGEHAVSMSDGAAEWESWQLAEKEHLLHDLRDVAAVPELKAAWNHLCRFLAATNFTRYNSPLAAAGIVSLGQLRLAPAHCVVAALRTMVGHLAVLDAFVLQRLTMFGPLLKFLSSEAGAQALRPMPGLWPYGLKPEAASLHVLVADAYDGQCEVLGLDWLHKSGMARTTCQLTAATYWLSTRVFAGLRVHAQHDSFLLGQPEGVSTDTFILITLLATKPEWSSLTQRDGTTTTVRQPIWCAALNGLRRLTDEWLKASPRDGPDLVECVHEDTMNTLNVLAQQAGDMPGCDFVGWIVQYCLMVSAREAETLVDGALTSARRLELLQCMAGGTQPGLSAAAARLPPSCTPSCTPSLPPRRPTRCASIGLWPAGGRSRPCPRPRSRRRRRPQSRRRRSRMFIINIYIRKQAKSF